MRIKKKFISDMAKDRFLTTPTLAKKNMVVASLKPNPPIEIGKSVIAHIIGMNIKKYRSFIFRPNDKAITKKVSGAVT